MRLGSASSRYERAMALVDDHELGTRLGSIPQGVDRRDLHHGAGSAQRIARHDHADVFGREAEFEQALVRLRDQLAPVRDEESAISTRSHQADQLGRTRSLASAGGKHEQDAPHALSHERAHALDGLDLVRSKVQSCFSRGTPLRRSGGPVGGPTMHSSCFATVTTRAPAARLVACVPPVLVIMCCLTGCDSRTSAPVGRQPLESHFSACSALSVDVESWTWWWGRSPTGELVEYAREDIAIVVRVPSGAAVVDLEDADGITNAAHAEIREILGAMEVRCEEEKRRVGRFAADRESCSYVDAVDTRGLHHEWWLESDDHTEPIRYERRGRFAVVSAPRGAQFRVDIEHHAAGQILRNTTVDMSNIREIRCVPQVR